MLQSLIITGLRTHENVEAAQGALTQHGFRAESFRSGLALDVLPAQRTEVDAIAEQFHGRVIEGTPAPSDLLAGRISTALKQGTQGGKTVRDVKLPPFTVEITRVEIELERRLKPILGADFVANLDHLHRLLAMTKHDLESNLFATNSLVSLTDEDYKHLQETIRILIQLNESAQARAE